MNDVAHQLRAEDQALPFAVRAEMVQEEVLSREHSLEPLHHAAFASLRSGSCFDGHAARHGDHRTDFGRDRFTGRHSDVDNRGGGLSLYLVLHVSVPLIVDPEAIVRVVSLVGREWKRTSLDAASNLFGDLPQMRVRPGGQPAHRTGLHVDSPGAFDTCDQAFSTKEAGEDSASHAHLQADGRLVSNKMSSVDDEFAVDLSSEDSSVGSEPDFAVAADFEAEQSFATDEARDAGPAEPQVHGGFAGKKSSRLKKHRRSLQLDALNVAREWLSQHNLARAGRCEFVNE